MEIWLDTICIEDIKYAKALGILFGVTTNPSILASAKTRPNETLEQILTILSPKSPLAVQVSADSADEMLLQAKQLRQLSERIIIKVPVTAVGLQAMALMRQENIPIMATAIVGAQQLLLAALAQADYAAPYLHTMERNSINYHDELSAMSEIIKQQQLSTTILAASIDTSAKIVECARLGIPAITLPTHVFNEFIKTPALVNTCMEKFKQDWKKSGYDSDALFSMNS